MYNNAFTVTTALDVLMPGDKIEVLQSFTDKSSYDTWISTSTSIFPLLF